MIGLEKKLGENQSIIEDWFLTQWKKTPAPVYGSVDLRNAGFKLAPVDMNLFPAGFNNLNPQCIPLSVEAARSVLPSKAKRILLIPENHTRNLFYWENIKVLIEIITQAGFEVKVGSLVPIDQVEMVQRKQNKLGVKDFVADLVLLNNDLSEGIPDLLQDLEQPVLPLPKLGWSFRSKAKYFKYYNDVSHEFAKLIDIDPWIISPLFRRCTKVDFMQREGEACVAEHTQELLSAIQQKYDEYKIDYKPFVMVKADAGTYGMAIMTAYSADDLRNLNRKQRTNMSKTKGGKPVGQVIIQEGVYTFETFKENAVAEPVVYLWGEKAVGGFYRVHKERGRDENLNSPGMQFEPLVFSKNGALDVIARLSMLAAARETMEL